MSVSSRTNVRAILANPGSEQASPQEKPMWLKLIHLDPPNLTNLGSIKLKAVLYGKSNELDTENMLDVLDQIYETLEPERKSFLNFYFVDKSDQPSVNLIHGVNQFPTLLFFAAGMQIKKIVGTLTSVQLQENLTSLFKISDRIADRINKAVWEGGELMIGEGDWQFIFEYRTWDGRIFNVEDGNWSLEEV